MTSSPLRSKYLLQTVAPLAIAAGFAFAAHSGWLCNGGTNVTVIAKAEKGTAVEVYRDGKKVRAKAKKETRSRDPRKADRARALGKAIYRANETHWVPRSVVQELFVNGALRHLKGRLVPVRECRDVVGLRLTDLGKRGLVRRLGFREGDMITAIDGVRMSSRRAARRAVQGIENADQVTVTVVRNDQTLQKTFLIE